MVRSLHENQIRKQDQHRDNFQENKSPSFFMQRIIRSLPHLSLFQILIFWLSPFFFSFLPLKLYMPSLVSSLVFDDVSRVGMISLCVFIIFDFVGITMEIRSVLAWNINISSILGGGVIQRA